MFKKRRSQLNRHIIHCCCLILLFGLGWSCNNDLRLPLDPTLHLDEKMSERLNKAAKLPVRADLKHSLQTPAGHRKLYTVETDGILYQQYQPKLKAQDERYILRSLLIPPRALYRLQIYFSDQRYHPLSSEALLRRKEIHGLVNGSFFGSYPAGDMLGQRCDRSGEHCQPGIFFQSETRSGKNLNLRYCFVIDRLGKAGIFRGGLGPKSYRSYRTALGGGILLFDKIKSPDLYQAVGSKKYNTLYSQTRYNHRDLLASGQGGFPLRYTPRTAMGILPSGAVVIVTLGEGKYRYQGGANPAQMALLLKQMGAVKALLFDGGGAPQLALKNNQNQLIVRSLPEVTRKSNYLNNYSFIGIQQLDKKTHKITGTPRP